MIDNYEIDQFGVIHQINSTPFNYDSKYVNHYHKGNMLRLSEQMAYLRLGYILGNLKISPEKMLDVGIGNGSFCEAAMRICANVYGYDVFDNPFLPRECEKANSLTDQYYDIITFFDSLEHCENLDFIKDLDCRYVVISVPWCHNLNDQWFESWKHRKPNEHLHHFNDVSLRSFMNENGFQYMAHSNIEDAIRKPVDELPNILTAIFEKR